MVKFASIGYGDDSDHNDITLVEISKTFESGWFFFLSGGIIWQNMKEELSFLDRV